jgi:hypothetical protein
MTRDQILARLVALRRRREERAIERAIQCDGACRRAAQHVEDALEAASSHQSQSRQQEHELIGSLVGQIVPTNVLHGLQATLDAAATAQDRLRAAHADAQSALREHLETRNAAQTVLRDCRRAVTKLDYLQQRAMTKEQRRRESLAEAADEDRGRRAAF